MTDWKEVVERFEDDVFGSAYVPGDGSPVDWQEVADRMNCEFIHNDTHYVPRIKPKSSDPSQNITN